MRNSNRRDLPQAWCKRACPRQQTGMWKDCNCGGAQKEFDYLQAERRKTR